MYLPDHFAVGDREAMRALIDAHALATIVTADADGLDANHVPLMFEPDVGPRGVLRGHVARANPLWQALKDRPQVLAIFQGPQHYVSPAWYPSKQIDPRVVPTWNYAVVHAHGTAHAIEDREWLRTLVSALTDRYERERTSPWHVTDAPAPFVDKMLAGIVGIEIEITRLVGKWKASQNRSAADREGVQLNAGDGSVPDPASRRGSDGSEVPRQAPATSLPRATRRS
jgi:transcriptional regulator